MPSLDQFRSLGGIGACREPPADLIEGRDLGFKGSIGRQKDLLYRPDLRMARWGPWRAETRTIASPSQSIAVQMECQFHRIHRGGLRLQGSEIVRAPSKAFHRLFQPRHLDRFIVGGTGRYRTLNAIDEPIAKDSFFDVEISKTLKRLSDRVGQSSPRRIEKRALMERALPTLRVLFPADLAAKEG